MSLAELFSCSDDDVRLMTSNLKQVADGLGLPFGNRKMTYNSRLAQELGKWAESKGKGDEFHNAVFHAYLVAGKNIGDMPVLTEIIESVELDSRQAEKIITDRTFKPAVDADWNRSLKLKIKAVPTFLLNHDVLVGAQNYEALQTLLLSNHVPRRSY